MFEVRYQDGPAVIALRGGQWVGDECVFEFTATGAAAAGVARCNWTLPQPEFELVDGRRDEPSTAAILDKLSVLLSGFHRGAFAGITDQQLESLYSGSYHAQMGYAVGSAQEAQRKGHIADLVLRLTSPRKVLVAGCSAGECIRQLRARGVEAFGFDIARDVEQLAYPDVRPWVRRGSVTAIPFAAADRFDVLTALDLFEHVPEDRIPSMSSELVRLGIRDVVALIAHCEFQYPGHVTLRPLSWWEQALAPAFRRVPHAELPDPWPVVEPGSSDPTKLLRVFRRTSAGESP